MKDKVIIVTGSGKGIGRAIVEKLALDNSVVGLTRSDVGTTQADIDWLICDVSVEGDVVKCVDLVLKKYGRIDVLINNAGVGAFGLLEDMSFEFVKQLMEINVNGTFLMNKYVVPVMKEIGGGHIVQIASDVSKRTFSGGSIYCASKYAQEAMVSSLRSEVRPFNIKVSTIYPGMTDTYFADSQPGEDHKKDWLSPNDIADAVDYILNAPAHVVVDELMLHPMSQEY